ncbi:MAG TPA: ScyD/ScyE family protein [Glaciibacter sp.]|nr:ScyD/ScyE family protein [Glaciibacter sp.]
MKKRIAVAAACTAALASLALATPASATWSPLSFGKVSTIADGLVTPLSLAVDATGNSYVAQNFIGTLTRVTPAGTQSTVATAPEGDEIGAVSSLGGNVYFAQGSVPEVRWHLMAMAPNGTPEPLADLGAWEQTENPDQVNTYGFLDLDEACLAQFPPEVAGFARYTGIIDSHVYASTATSHGIFVADAGGNDILRVGYDGSASTVAVLPPAPPVAVSAELAAQFGFPECAVGARYSFEPVPTDVELGPDGWLYVTSLPGGPEDASLGARGAVYKVNPWTGEVLMVASGFVGATNLAVERNTGAILVTELFGGPEGTGQVSVVLPGEDTPAAAVPVRSPAAIELRGGTVYVTHDAFVLGEMGPEPIGKLTTFSLTGTHHAWDSVLG